MLREDIDVSFAASQSSPSYGSREKCHVRKRNSHANDNPTQDASGAVALRDVGLNDQEADCRPKDDFKAVDDGESLVALIFLEALHVCAAELVEDEHERLGRL